MRRAAFEFDGRHLEVVATERNGIWTVIVCESGHTVGRMQYSVTSETAMDAAVATNATDIVLDLMQTARRDVEEGRVALNDPFN
jgi:hypothetical protein